LCPDRLNEAKGYEPGEGPIPGSFFRNRGRALMLYVKWRGGPRSLGRFEMLLVLKVSLELKFPLWDLFGVMEMSSEPSRFWNFSTTGMAFCHHGYVSELDNRAIGSFTVDHFQLIFSNLAAKLEKISQK